MDSLYAFQMETSLLAPKSISQCACNNPWLFYYFLLIFMPYLNIYEQLYLSITCPKATKLLFKRPRIFLGIMENFQQPQLTTTLLTQLVFDQLSSIYELDIKVEKHSVQFLGSLQHSIGFPVIYLGLIASNDLAFKASSNI